MNNRLILKRKHFFRDSIISIIIVLLPFIFFLYNIAPKNTQDWNIKIFTIRLTNNYNVDYLFWIISYKLLLITILIIWFITCKHWWRFVILTPFSIELFKFLSVINDELQFILNFSFIHTIPLLIPSIIVLIYLSKKLNYYSFKKSLNNKLNNEIDILMQNSYSFKSENYKDFKKQLIQLRQEKSTLSKKEYLKKLIRLREAFSTQK